MRADTVARLKTVSVEEEGILSGGGLDFDKYFRGGVAVISDAQLFGGKAEIGIRRHTRFAEFPEHKHAFVELMIVLSGSITHCISGREITLREGDMLFLNKHQSHSIKKTDIGDIGVNIMLSDGFIAGIGAELSGTVFASLVRENAVNGGSGAYLHFKTGGVTAIENLTENIILELLSGCGGTVATKTVEILLSYLARGSDKLLVGADIPKDKRTERMTRISDYIKASCTGASLSELAGELYLSVPYLSKIIVLYFGKSFKELVVDERMRRAYNLIYSTDMQIGDVIHSVGYENESYFHREFKARFGTSPLTVRKKSKQNSQLCK